MSNTDPAEWRLFQTDLTTQLAILPVVSAHPYFELDEPGSGEVRIPLDSAIASSVAIGQFIHLYYRGSSRGGFFVDNVKITNADASEGAGRMLSVSGRGALALLDDAIVWTDGDAAATTRDFSGVTKASILITLIDEAIARGALSILAYDFSATVDSSSVAWTDSEEYKLNVGMSLLDVARQFAATGSFDYSLSLSAGVWTLHAYSAGVGTNVSSTVYLRVGQNCEEVGKDQRGGDEIDNAYLAKWKDGYITDADSTSVTAYRRKESFISLEQAQSSASATTYTAAKLSLTKDPKTSKSIRVYDGIKPYVFVDYVLGDTVSLDILGTVTSERVLGIQADFDGTDFLHLVLETGAIMRDNDMRMAAQLDWLSNQWSTAHDANLQEVSQWMSLGVCNGAVNSLFVYNGDLYVFGDFTIIANIAATRAAKYNIATATWSALSTGIASEVLAALNIGTTIYAVTGTTVYKYVAGVWSSIGVCNAAIKCIATDGTNLFVGGSFGIMDGSAIIRVAKWTGAAWSNSHNTNFDTCTGLAYFNGFLYANLQTVADTDTLQYFSGGSWHILFASQSKLYTGIGTDGNWLYYVGADNHSYRYDGAGVTYDEDLGDILDVGITSYRVPYAAYLTDAYIGNATSPNGIIKYSGGLFSTLGAGTAVDPSNIGIRAIVINETDVYAGGGFTTMDGQPLSYIAVYVTDFQSMVNHLQNDIGAMDHERLSGLLGGATNDHYHLTGTQKTDLTDGGDTTLHVHTTSGREKLTASRTYYVRTDGSDSNNGLANTSGGAFLTVQKSIDTVATLDINANIVTIQIADGTYTGTVVLKSVVGFSAAGNLVIQGNNSTPANVLINTTGSAFRGDGLNCVWDIKDLKIQSTVVGIYALTGTKIRFGNIDFGACTSSHIRSESGSNITVLSNYAITGNAPIHEYALFSASLTINNVTVTLTGTPAFATAFAAGQFLGFIQGNGNTYTGAATGARYSATMNGAINTSGGGANYFPGNAAGATATGGQYA